MASIAKDSLSPLLKSASARRRSLDLCQKLGNQLLSPTNLTTLFSPGSKTPSSTKSDGSNFSFSPGSTKSTSPFKTLEDSKFIVPGFSQDSSDQFVGSSNPDPNYHYKRRASDSLWIDTFPKVVDLTEGVPVEGNQRRRRSLVPGQLEKATQPSSQENDFHESVIYDGDLFSPNLKEQNERKTSAAITCNVIPPTPAKSERKKKVINIPSCALETCSDDDDEEAGNTDVPDCAHGFSKIDLGSRVGAKYDLDENFVKLIAQRWNLTLKFDELLGKGSFGTVMGGNFRGQPVAVKILKMSRRKEEEALISEGNALTLPFHQHIVQTLDIFRIDPDRALIVMEKVHKGSLQKLLNDPTFEISCSTAINFVKQIALALMFCHREGLLHLDVKPQNILVDMQNCCKLSDFGSSKRISDLREDDNYQQNYLNGTVPYIAPEIFRGLKPTEKCDVYSLAITMWQILTREVPYEDENEHTVIFKVVARGLRPKQAYTADDNNNWCPPPNAGEKVLEMKYTELYTQAWQSNPDDRPTISDLHKSLLKLQFLG